MGTLTTDRLLTLVDALVKKHGRAVGAALIVAEARAASWGEHYRYQRVYTALKRCEAQGVLQRVRAPSAARGRGTHHESYVWWPTYAKLEQQHDRDADEEQLLDRLVDHAVARLNVGTVLTARWIVTKLVTLRPSTTDDEVRATLRRRTDDQRPALTECAFESGWAGWWRVASADPDRASRGERSASDALWRRVRAAQRRTGHTAVEVRTITRSVSASWRRTLIARVVIACRVPKPNTNLILLTPRLVRCGAVHYASYVAPLGEEHIAAAELDVEAWWYAVQLLERRHAQERRFRGALGDDAMAAARRVPYAHTFGALKAALHHHDNITQDGESYCRWRTTPDVWLASNPWVVSADEFQGRITEPATVWMTIPALQRHLSVDTRIARPPSVRLLRILLQHGGVWMRPTRLISRDRVDEPRILGARAESAVVVETVDVFLWLSARFLDRANATHWRWVRRWIGLCRDWHLISSVAQRAQSRWCDIATSAVAAQRWAALYR